MRWGNPTVLVCGCCAVRQDRSFGIGIVGAPRVDAGRGCALCSSVDPGGGDSIGQATAWPDTLRVPGQAVTG